MITIERSQHDTNKKPWWWISGSTRPHKELFKRYGARWSRKRQAWYLIAHDLPESIRALADNPPNPKATSEISADEHEPCSVEEAATLLGMNVKTPAAQHIADDKPLEKEEEIAPIRVLVHEDTDESLKETLHKLKASPPTPTLAIQVPAMSRQRIPQAACGELTGSITGQVWCYGWAVHEGICIYLNMAGPKMATEAIRARLAKGDIVNLIPDDAAAIELTAGEGQMGMYTDFLQNIPEAKFASRILVHEALIEANYGGKSTTYIFHLNDEQAIEQVRQHITELVNVAVFNAWSSYLWQAGRQSKLIRKIRSGGGLKLWALELDSEAWTRILTGGLAEKLISLPTIT